MAERLLRHLKPEITRELLPLAQRLTGKAPRIKRVESLPNDVHGMLLAPEAPSKPWEIHYVRGQERFLEHLIGHEVGHVVRLFRVPQEERLQPAVSGETRARAAEQVVHELVLLMGQGVPMEVVLDLFNMQYEGLCTQLASAPADLRIEQWLFNHYPGLHRVQERSLVKEVERSFPLFAAGHRVLTPPSIWRAQMAMNAAQAWQVAILFNQPELLALFQEHGLGIPGRNLARMVLDAPDEGHRSDMEAVNRWAEELGLTGWFEWAAYEGSR